jgi:DNA-binding transcriptional MocR family regulator
VLLAGPDRNRFRAGLEWIADLFLSVSTPVQNALPGLLRSGEHFRARTRERIVASLAQLDALTARCPEVTRLRGQGGWSAVLRVPSRRSDEEWALALLERGVLVHPGHFYDLEGGSFLVVSLLPEPVVLREGLERMVAVMETA